MTVDNYIEVIHHLNKCLYDECLKFALIGVSEVALMDRQHRNLTAKEYKLISEAVKKYENM